jgi:hypothetical protein
MTVATTRGMTPLVVAGAVSLGKYVVDRIDSRLSAPSLGSASESRANFRTTLQQVSQSTGVGQGNGAESSRLDALERQLLQSGEVRSALNGLPREGGVALELRSDGGMAIHSSQGVREIVVSEETRSLAQRIHAQRVVLDRVGGATASGSSRSAEELRSARGSLGCVFLTVTKSERGLF